MANQLDEKPDVQQQLKKLQEQKEEKRDQIECQYDKESKEVG